MATTRRQRFHLIRLAWATALALTLTSGETLAVWPDPPKLDRHGDPLPEGALFRLGTIRLRHPDGINSSALSPDGKYLATAARAHLAVWDLASGKRLHWFRDCGITDGFDGTKVAFSPDGTKLAHVCQGKVAARVWDLKTGKLALAFGKPRPNAFGFIGGAKDPEFDPNAALRYSSDGKELLLYGDTLIGSFQIASFDARTGARLRKVSVPAEPHCFSPDGKHFAAFLRSPDPVTKRTVVIGSTASGQEQTRIELPVTEKGRYYSRAIFSPDGKALAVTDGEGEIRIFAGGKERQRFRLPALTDFRNQPLAITLLLYAPDGRTLFAGTRAHGVQRIDLDTGKTLRPMSGHLWWVTGLHVTADGKILVSTSWDSTVRRYDLVRAEELPLPPGYVWRVSAGYAPDSKLVAAGDHNGRLDLWDTRTGKLLRNLRSSGPGIERVVFSPAGKTLAVACQDGVVRLLDASSGKETGSLALPPEGEKTTPDRRIHDLVFSEDGSRLVTMSRENDLGLWNVTDRKLVWSVKLTRGPTAAFSPDGKRLVTGGWDSKITFRNPDTGAELLTALLPQGAIVDSLTFSPDGKLLASTHHDGLIRFWDPASGKELKALKGHNDAVWMVRFSPDGRWVVSGGVDGTVRLWEVSTAREVRKFVGQDAWVFEVAFAPDARSVLASGSTQVLLWDVRPGASRGSDVAMLWEQLGSSDALKGYAAVWVLSERSKEAAALLREKIVPVKMEDPERIARWITDLDSPRFAVREAAMKALAGRGETAAPALREALKKMSSLEVKRRLEILLKALEHEPTPEEIRQGRALQALELAGTPEARQVLQGWASGEAGAALTEESRAVLARLKQRDAARKR